jgi:hypothetical protein
VLRRLELGAYQGLMVVVRSGLNPGDQLVVRGHRDLRNGNLVRITEEATAADGTIPADPSDVIGAGSAGRISGEQGAGDGSLKDTDVEAGR